MQKHKMKITLEVHTTTSRPIYLFIDDDILLRDLHKQIIYDIEHSTMLSKDDILDIYVTNVDEVLSIPSSLISIKEFININSHYFQSSSSFNQFHKIYVIDKIYISRTRLGLETPIYNENKPKYSWRDLLQSTMSSIYL